MKTMRGFRRVRWVFAILAFFWGALFFYGAFDFHARGQTMETIVASVIGVFFCALGYPLVPRSEQDEA